MNAYVACADPQHRHETAVSGERLEAAMRDLHPADPQYPDFANAVHTEARMAVVLARALRISPQQARNHRVLRLASNSRPRRPWDDDGAA